MDKGQFGLQIRVRSWDDWVVLLELYLPYEDAYIDHFGAGHELFKQHPLHRNTFVYREFEFNLNDIFQGIEKNSFSMLCLQTPLNDYPMMAGNMKQFKNSLAHFPSDFNYLSILVRSKLADNDIWGVKAFLKDNLPWVSDESGNVLEAL